MLERILVVAAVLELVQFLSGIFIHADATRRQLERPVTYVYGALFPLVGLLVAGVYLSRRDEFPTHEPAVPTTAETGDTVTWTVEHRGLRRLPLRLVCAIQYGRRVWLVGAVAPPVLLALTVLVHPVVAIFLSTVCTAYWFTYLQETSMFTNTTVRLAPADQRIEITTRGGDHPLSNGGSEEVIDLTEVKQAALRQVDGQPLVKFRYDNPLSVSPLMIPVSPTHVDDVRRSLAAREIPLRDRVRDGTNEGAVRRRILVTACSLGIVPLVAGVRWSQQFVTSPIALFVGFSILWLVLKPFA